MEPGAQARLGEIYAPILFLHRDDAAPISPAEYIRRSGLWSNLAFGTSLPTVEPAKNLWSGPELLPGTIAASPEDFDIAERSLLWDHMRNNPTRHFFLDHGGWDNQTLAPFPPLLQAGEVNDTTDNLMGSAGAAHGGWDYRIPNSELDHSIGWYSVQALDMDDLRLELGEALGSNFLAITAALPRHWMIFYHFFFPYRSERISLCEFVRTLNDLHLTLPFSVRAELETFFENVGQNSTEVPPGPIVPPGASLPNVHDPWSGSGIASSALTDAGLPYSLTWAIHLGQFITVGLVVPEVPESDGGPDAPVDRFEPPLFVGFGQSAAVRPRNYGQLSTVPKMEIYAPIQGLGPGLGSPPLMVGNHPQVYLSPFTHNTRRLPGEYARPISEAHDPICAPERGGGIDEDLPYDEKKRRRRKIGINIAKLLTSGLLIGVFSSMLEATAEAEGGLPDIDPLPSDPDDSVSEEVIGLVLKPEDVQLAAELMDRFSDDVVVRNWGGTPEERVYNESWKNPKLSWGPPVLQDPGLRRQGQPMPNYLEPFINELGRQLELGG